MADVLNLFHRDLAASLAAGIRLDLGTSPSLPSGRATSRKLQRLEQVISERMAGGQSIRSITGDDADLPSQYRAALALLDHCNASEVAIEGMAAKADSRVELTRAIRMPLIYVIGVLLFASVLLKFFDEAITPSFTKMREDLKLVPIIDAPPRFDSTQWAEFLATLSSATAAVLVLVMSVGGAARLAVWLGGRRFQTDLAASRALRAVDLLVRSGVAVDESVENGCALVGDPAARRRVHSVLKLRDAARSDTRSGQHDDPSDRVSETESIAQTDSFFGGLADQLHRSACRRLGLLSSLYPVAIVFTIGGTVTALYCLIIFLPLVDLLKDLAIPMHL